MLLYFYTALNEASCQKVLLSHLTSKGMLLSFNVGCEIIDIQLAWCLFSHAALSFDAFVICWYNDPADSAYCLTFGVCNKMCEALGLTCLLMRVFLVDAFSPGMYAKLGAVKQWA